MMTASPVLTIDGLVKRFGQRTILNGIGMTVMPGEIVCLVGPSGTGKSTLLRCINGLEGIQSGHIVFDGLKVRAHARDVIEVRKRIGMIFQQFNLYPHLTALQNVMLAPVVVHREARQAVEARARALLDRWYCACRIASTRIPTNSPAANSSESLSPGRWQPSHTCSCSTSRPRHSTPKQSPKYWR